MFAIFSNFLFDTCLSFQCLIYIIEIHDKFWKNVLFFYFLLDGIVPTELRVHFA